MMVCNLFPRKPIGDVTPRFSNNTTSRSTHLAQRTNLNLANVKCSNTILKNSLKFFHSAIFLRCSNPERQLPEDVHFEVSNQETSTSEFQYDEETKTMRVQLSALDGDNRRTRLVTFTCNKCGGRTTRAVNPIAWEKGMVYGQCSQCSVWHVLSAKNPKIYEEIRFTDESDKLKP
ncbi:hypothetical protein CEUSTIGMA_g2324.t1 [Chlamydomonas eustigma]|uniref:DNL-type domain-containing protein n=1 Tax=Chlamydomonas eustigma TaxID=1157962 RepID=A0A250WVM6_9CHLO|nr:hypothetical protein CEUSTIGMA_g2324.t1 [Chlamydomonas eustigma]|eukprot:GAX74878.1 hypothetical protein CEUSTIGMA_g2324.t1 [Chlamydomonas eustigma]